MNVNLNPAISSKTRLQNNKIFHNKTKPNNSINFTGRKPSSAKILSKFIAQIFQEAKMNFWIKLVEKSPRNLPKKLKKIMDLNTQNVNFSFGYSSSPFMANIYKYFENLPVMSEKQADDFAKTINRIAQSLDSKPDLYKETMLNTLKFRVLHNNPADRTTQINETIEQITRSFNTGKVNRNEYSYEHTARMNAFYCVINTISDKTLSGKVIDDLFKIPLKVENLKLQQNLLAIITKKFIESNLFRENPQAGVESILSKLAPFNLSKIDALEALDKKYADIITAKTAEDRINAIKTKRKIKLEIASIAEYPSIKMEKWEEIAGLEKILGNGEGAANAFIKAREACLQRIKAETQKYFNDEILNKETYSFAKILGKIHRGENLNYFAQMQEFITKMHQYNKEIIKINPAQKGLEQETENIKSAINAFHSKLNSAEIKQAKIKTEIELLAEKRKEEEESVKIALQKNAFVELLAFFG